MICNQYKTDLRDILKQLCSYKGVEILEGHFMPDYVHMLVSILTYMYRGADCEVQVSTTPNSLVVPGISHIFLLHACRRRCFPRMSVRGCHSLGQW